MSGRESPGAVDEMCPCGTPGECIPGTPGCVIRAERCSLFHDRDLHVIANEWLEHEGFYRYVDRRRSTAEVHAMAAAYLRLKAENARYETALRRIATIPHNVPSMPSATEIADKALDGESE